MAKKGFSTSIRYSLVAKRLIDLLAAKLGVNQTAIIEMAIRVLAEKENIDIYEREVK